MKSLFLGKGAPFQLLGGGGEGKQEPPPPPSHLLSLVLIAILHFSAAQTATLPFHLGGLLKSELE